MKRIGLSIYVIVSICLAVLTINNNALFYHITSLYTDSLPQISLVGSYKLIPRLFSSDISLYTHGEYRPLGYVFMGICRSILGGYFAPNSLHIIALIIHLLNTFFFFMILKEFISGIPAIIIGLIFLIHPIFVLMFNDPNQVTICLGLFFSLSSLYFYLLYLRKRSLSYFFLSIVIFVFAILTSKLAIFVPVFQILFHHLGQKHKKITIGISLYLAFFLVFIELYNINTFFIFLGALLFIFIFVLNSAEHKGELLSVSLHVIPFLAIILIWYALSNYVGIKPVYQYPLSRMDSSHILKPFYLLYAWKSIFKGNLLYILLITPFFIIPFLMNGEKWQNIVLAGFIIFFATFSVKLCRAYRNDVTYWEKMSKDMDDPVEMVNLAQAYIRANKFEKAENILYGLKYERGKLPPLVDDTVNVDLGILYHRMGRDKISAYYFLQKPHGALPGASKIAKWRLIPIGDLFFDLGYLSYAENFYASALVLDPYDIRIFKRLGEVLIYKDFFRAAIRYFDRVLKYDPCDKESLYYAAFASRIIGDKDKYAMYMRRWKGINPKKSVDFQRIYAKYKSFNRDKTRAELSGDPVVLFYTGETDKRFVYRLDHKKYIFWEVPLEVGKYFYKRGKYDAAIAFLAYASDLSGGAKEVLEYLKMAQEKKAMPTQREIMRAIKEQEMMEREMLKKGGKPPWNPRK